MKDKLLSYIPEAIQKKVKGEWVNEPSYWRLDAHAMSPAFTNSVIETAHFLLRNPNIAAPLGGLGLVAAAGYYLEKFRHSETYQSFLYGPPLRSGS